MVAKTVQTSDQVLINSIRVDQLFGLYSYRIPSENTLSNAAIIYGDNGVGKSTILRLVFHLMSAAGNRGHRTALYKVPFRLLEVTLASGATLRAERTESLTNKVLRLSILKTGGQLAAQWDYTPRAEAMRTFTGMEDIIVEIASDGRPRMRRVTKARSDKEKKPIGEEIYLQALKEVSPTVYMLSADRHLDSDSVADPSDEVELRRLLRFDEPKRINDLVVRSRTVALSQALNAASRWISQKAVVGTNRGSMNVHTVYSNVLRHLGGSTQDQSESQQIDLNKLISRLCGIEERAAQAARYELATELSMNDFRRALQVRAKSKAMLAAQLIEPYVRSLEGRLEAIEPVYKIVDRFISLLNQFLGDKTIAFKLSHGFSIANKLGATLEPEQLSSGEQQLLLLFCYVLVGRDKSSVFMIDEPELSLNVKWQRQLVQSLLSLTDGSRVQFILATHSLELLSQHREHVVQLVNLQ